MFVKKAVKEDWDFANADIHYMTHGLHLYPARMIPQVARRLVERYSLKGARVLDPFCGSGGVLVESILTGRNAVGIDINPLACLLARVKTTPIDPKLLIVEWGRLREVLTKEIVQLRFKGLDVDAPDFPDINIEYWFKPYMIKELALIKNHLDNLEEKIRKFFYVCFSNTIRAVSGVRKGEFKLYRMSPDQWKSYNPNVFKVFEEKVNNSISKMGEFFDTLAMSKVRANAEVFEADTRDMFTEQFPSNAQKSLEKESIDLIVTSPPYGDSHTTVAYGQFSRYSLIWLGYDKEEVLEIDKRSLGGRMRDNNLKSNTLDSVLQKIPDERRAKEVKSFFVDLDECLNKLYHVLSDKGYACFVLGNRTVNKVRIPTDEIITELGKNIGFDRLTVIHRRIPSKRIPWKSSPTNIPGQKVETISRENIVILGK